MTDTYILFTDAWWNWFVHEYAFSLVILWALLKTLAILDPTNKTNDILDSFRSFLNTGMNRRTTDKDYKPDDKILTKRSAEGDVTNIQIPPLDGEEKVHD